MKVETKKVYTFEDGDVIVNRAYNYVAIRLSHDTWHSTQEDWLWTDESVFELLDSGDWAYMGNRLEMI